MWSDRPLLMLFERFPPRTSIFKASEGRPDQEYEREAARPFHEWFGLSPGALFDGKDVLDLGSGFGGSAVRFLDYGARSVTGLETSSDKVEHSREFARQRGVENETRFRMGRGEDLPFPNREFDLVTMHDVLEHVVSPSAVMSEVYRVLRPSGLFATVFPPYYDLTGGSHLHGYVTSVPGLNLVFPTRALKSAARQHLDQHQLNWQAYLREVPTDKLWNMNGLTVRGFKRLVRESRFEPVSIRYLGHRDPRTRNTNPAPLSPTVRPVVRALQGLAQVRVVQEAFCSRVAALLRR